MLLYFISATCFGDLTHHYKAVEINKYISNIYRAYGIPCTI
jgi:hypothetical protein